MKRNTSILPTAPGGHPPLRVALVEDEQKIRESWSRLIDSFPDFKCVCACASGEEALRVVPAARPDVILMDVLLPGISGIECTLRLKELLPQTQTIILTALDDDELIFRALEAGADGYLLKRTKRSRSCAPRPAGCPAWGRAADQRHRAAGGHGGFRRALAPNRQDALRLSPARNCWSCWPRGIPIRK